MKDDRKIVIEIVSRNENDLPVNPYGIVNDDPQQAVNPAPSISEKKLLAQSIIVNQAYREAKRLIQEGIGIALNRRFDLKEDYLMENDYNLVMASIGKATSFGTAVLAGAKFGGMAGAAIAGTTWVIGEGMAEFNKYSQHYQSLNASNQQTAFSRERAGLYNEGKGTEN